ncbi:ABC transporter substrate-binding protein [Nostoc sp. LEGE 12447]|uniref:ABC transporter substrate-binding protein n=1 Tax=Nostoc sp. LEGE 12447 TaxID=1828640 RepID=UPI001883EEDE|nr:ABC transporter substrate-binding protein [Nostoc sp. LEGE 12447]MBE9002739.1 ABC transporter substrate-binding protein [Nostoc sp. LEGE 12447]
MINNSKVHRNPYIIGNPINEKEKLFGRESLFSLIKDHLDQDVKVILLHGLRRIGKSSVLQQFTNFIDQDKFVCVNFDLQDKARMPLSELIHSLATAIIEQLELDIQGLESPTREELEQKIDIFAYIFLPKIYEKLGDKKLVLLLDEFDVIDSEKVDIISKGAGFFPYLQSLISNQKQLFIIPVVGRHVAELENVLALFQRAPNQEIGLLDEVSTRLLITKPNEETQLKYEQEAIEKIYQLSAGHPLFTQVIGFTIFEKARDKNNWIVTLADVEGVVDKALENAEGGLSWFWDGLSIPQKVIFSAITEAQKIAGKLFPEDPFSLIKRYGVIQTEELIQAVDQLAKKGWVDNTKRRVKVDLVRYWMEKYHPIQQEISQLENQKLEEVYPLCKRASQLCKEGKKQDALHLYETILTLNPNHFRTLPRLAEIYLEIDNFDKALELYERAYNVDNRTYQGKLLSVLKNYADKLIEQRELAKAIAQLQRILEIEPNNQSAQEKLKEIQVENLANKQNQVSVQQPLQTPANRFVTSAGSTTTSLPIEQKGLIKRGAVICILAIAGISVIAYQILAPCPSGQKKGLFGFACQASLTSTNSRIISSRGERTLFSNITDSNAKHNINREKGIEAFKNNDYSSAREFFKNARKANYNDPEVLIYENNAKAREKGKPLILAVVVPADNAQSIAQEILRGVAQAQEQFNVDGGFNSRLLEIVIANDADDPKQAQEVAQQLIKDTDILGVIGHYSSRATKEALVEYTQAKLPVISPSSTSTELQSDVFFRTIPSDAISGKQLAEYGVKQLRLNKVIVYFDSDSSYSRSLRESFEEQFKQLGGEIVQRIDFSKPNLDVKKELEDSVVNYQAQGVLLFPDLKNTDVSLELVKVKLNPIKSEIPNLQFLGGDTLYSEKAFASEGLIVSIPWFREAPQSQNFVKKAVGLWEKKISWRTATSFDATQTFIQALKTFSSNPSRSEVLERLRQVNLTESLTSGYKLQFTRYGERQTQPILVKVEGGGFKQVLP